MGALERAVVDAAIVISTVGVGVMAGAAGCWLGASVAAALIGGLVAARGLGRRPPACLAPLGEAFEDPLVRGHASALLVRARRLERALPRGPSARQAREALDALARQAARLCTLADLVFRHVRPPRPDDVLDEMTRLQALLRRAQDPRARDAYAAALETRRSQLHALDSLVRLREGALRQLRDAAAALDDLGGRVYRIAERDTMPSTRPSPSTTAR